MSDLTLADGREIEIDLNAISIKEYRELFKSGQPDEEEFRTLAKACGMTAAEVEALGYVDYRRLLKAFIDKAREPLADPI